MDTDTLYLGDSVQITSAGVDLGGCDLYLDKQDSTVTLATSLAQLRKEIATLKLAKAHVDTSEFKDQLDGLYKYFFHSTPEATLGKWAEEEEEDSVSETASRVLLVSSTVADFLKTFKKADSVFYKKNVIVLPYDWNKTNSYADLLALIKKSVDSKIVISSIGCMFHNGVENNLQLFGKDTIKKTDTGLIEDFSNFKMFVASLKIEYAISDFDIISCNVVASKDGGILSTLKTGGVKINASINDTGSGGDWILEYGNINLMNTYFRRAIMDTGLNLMMNTTDLLNNVHYYISLAINVAQSAVRKGESGNASGVVQYAQIANNNILLALPLLSGELLKKDCNNASKKLSAAITEGSSLLNRVAAATKYAREAVQLLLKYINKQYYINLAIYAANSAVTEGKTGLDFGVAINIANNYTLFILPLLQGYERIYCDNASKLLYVAITEGNLNHTAIAIKYAREAVWLLSNDRNNWAEEPLEMRGDFKN